MRKKPEGLCAPPRTANINDACVGNSMRRREMMGGEEKPDDAGSEDRSQKEDSGFVAQFAAEQQKQGFGSESNSQQIAQNIDQIEDGLHHHISLLAPPKTDLSTRVLPNACESCALPLLNLVLNIALVIPRSRAAFATDGSWRARACRTDRYGRGSF